MIHFTVATITALDDDGNCPHCDRVLAAIEAQLYYADADGERRMDACCLRCIMPVVTTYGATDEVRVEIEAGSYRAVFAALYRQDVEPAA